MLDRPSTPTPLADAAPEDHFAWTQTLLIRQVERLEGLSALRLAQAIERQATEPSGLAAEASAKAGAEAPEAPPPALDAAALSFSRVARAMHTTALLQLRLIGELERARAREEARFDAEAEAADEEMKQDPAWEHKGRVEGIVARVARARLGDDDERALDRLMTEVSERLDDDDIYGDVMTRPVGELVSLICRDLGLDPDWPALAEEAWAKEEIESGVEGSPFLSSPLPLDGGEVGSGGDGSAAVRRTGHPHPQPFPHQGGRGDSSRSAELFNGSS